MASMNNENEGKPPAPPTRRKLLSQATAAAAAVLAHRAVSPAHAAPGEAPAGSGQKPASMADVAMRMREDLRRALRKPVEARRWVMVIDLRKCVGCHACSVACMAEYVLPPGIMYRHVVEDEKGYYPGVARSFSPRQCNHCDKPPCVPVCPAAATWKRADGVVEVDYEKCISCGACVAMCPYQARALDQGAFHTDGTPKRMAYEERPTFDYGRRWSRKEQKITRAARKCTFCVHRLDAGTLPACSATCIGAATFFGDANDPDSLVAELLRSPNKMRLQEESGTEPRVYYLV